MFTSAKLHFIFNHGVSLFRPMLSQKRPKDWKYM